MYRSANITRHTSLLDIQENHLFNMKKTGDCHKLKIVIKNLVKSVTSKA